MIPRAFVYGDLLFESILVQNGVPRHFELHLERLVQGVTKLGFADLPNSQILYKQLMEMLNGKQHARVRLTVFRNSVGFYLPTKNECLVDFEVFDVVAKPDTIKRVGIYLENHKPCNSLSNLKSGNALIYVVAAKYANDLGWDDALIVNEYGNICEATASNIFIQINGEYLTPPLSEGCVEGIMRKVFIQELKAAHKLVVEKPISKELLKSAECIWLTNAINGIRKVEKLLLT